MQVRQEALSVVMCWLLCQVASAKPDSCGHGQRQVSAALRPGLLLTSGARLAH